MDFPHKRAKNDAMTRKKTSPIRMNVFSLLLLLGGLAVPLKSQTIVTATDKKKDQKDRDNLPRNYLTVTTKAGDNVVKLLQRYELQEYECNADQFFKINKLSVEVNVKPGVKYKLPIVVFTYDGKSIRSTTGLKDWQAAKRVEQYNKNALQNGLRKDDFLVSKKLWAPWHELACTDDLGEGTEDYRPAGAGKKGRPVPAETGIGKDNRTFPIFGAHYAQTPLLSQRLKGRIFYLISGHAGPDPGAQGKRAGNTLCEDEYAYDVTLRLLRLLISHGATAYMIVRDPDDGIRDGLYLRCDRDEVVWGGGVIPVPQRERLQQRTDMINDFTERNLKAGFKDQTLIEIHVDSRSHDKETDVFFYYRPESEPSRQLALKIQKTFLQKYKNKQANRNYKGTVTDRYLFTLTETTVQKAVYIELANIQNDWDQQRLVLKNNRQALANWMFEAIGK